MPLPPLREPHDPVERATRVARIIPVLTLLGTSLMGINGVQALGAVTLRPVSPRRFRSFNRWAANAWWGLAVKLARSIHGVELEVTGDEVPARENAIVVLNHQDMPDISFLLDYAETKERLGDLKWMVKDRIKYVPGVGWGMVFLDCIFLKRDWTKDRDSIRKTFALLRDNDVPVWLMTFSEGTRIRPDKLAAAQQYARDHGLPEPRHVLIPRPKGFTATVEGLRDHIDAVYDVTIGYEEGVPNLWQYARGLATRCHLHVRRYPIEELPEEEAALAEWIRARFVEKDELLDHYYSNGSFPQTT